jgi:1-deoxy-D-xylulose-5-phosphate synthase
MYSEVLVAARSLLLQNVYVDIYALRFIKPVDEDYFIDLASKYDGIVFVEDGVVTGGIGAYLQNVLFRAGISNTAVKAFPDRFYSHGTREQICRDAHMSPEYLEKSALELACSVSSLHVRETVHRKSAGDTQ